MIAKQYLQRPLVIRRHIKSQELHLEELRAQAEHITADLTGMPRSGSTSSPVERVAVQIADLSWELELEWLDLLAAQADVKKTIDLVQDPLAQQVLSLRYLSYKSWREIADTMHYSQRHITRLHAKALALVDHVLE